MVVLETEPGRAGPLQPTLARRVQDHWGHRWVWRVSPPLDRPEAHVSDAVEPCSLFRVPSSLLQEVD